MKKREEIYIEDIFIRNTHMEDPKHVTEHESIQMRWKVSKSAQEGRKMAA